MAHKPMLTYPSDSRQASSRLRPMGPREHPVSTQGQLHFCVAARVTQFEILSFKVSVHSSSLKTTEAGRANSAMPEAVR
jgi:hypothetical protein